MDPDLRDLLIAFTGGDVGDARREALLARLAADAELRRDLAVELGTLGRIRASQAPEPRWLALEDAMTGGGSRPIAGDFERRILERAGAELRHRAGRRLWASAAAAALLAAALVWIGTRPGRPNETMPPPALAVVLESDGATPPAGGAAALRAGDTLRAGPLRLRDGRLTLALLTGVTLSIEGPADLDLASLERVVCRAGRLRVRAPKGTEGFTVLAPDCAIVDLGTAFGLSAAAGRPTEVMVFEGQAEVSLLGTDGATRESRLLERNGALSVDASAGRIRATDARPENFPPAPAPRAALLSLDAAYPDAVRAARPWGYWRFETVVSGAVPNEVSGGPALRQAGPARPSSAPVAHRAMVFAPDAADAPYLVLDGLWTPERARGYAVECWVLAEAYNRSTLVSLSPPPDGRPEGHSLLLELTARSRDVFHRPGAVRFLHRWPPGASGGMNVFSRDIYRPNAWTHLVAQRRPDRMELYVNGTLAGSAPIDASDGIGPCRVFVGRCVQHPKPELGQVRPFYGQIDELALYDRPLSAAEVREHAAMGAR